MYELLDLPQGLGFTLKDTDEVKGIFVDTNLFLLLVTFTVSAVHLVAAVLSPTVL
jgi:hypothetical protein